MSAPRLTLHDIEAFERWTPFARPFRFGAVTVEGASQAFVRLVVEVEGHGRAIGAAAELMPPKWFDKRPERSAAETVADLRASLARAVATASAAGRPDTAFGRHAAHYEAQRDWGREAGLTGLSSGFGVALIDKAVLDGLARALGTGFLPLLSANAIGLDARLTPDLGEAAIRQWLAGLRPRPSIAIRHTVGLTDPLAGPGGLAAELGAQALRFFKIKLGGDPAVDHERLAAVAAILDAGGFAYGVTVDANEQYGAEGLAELAARLEADARLKRLRAGLLLVEQPYDRRTTFVAALQPDIAALTVIIDEADEDYDAFPRALALGYRGVSSKSCKGIYKALLNGARVMVANAGDGARHVLSAEDLTCQPGLAVQQDTALVAAMGLGHVERNGHHYVDGFGPAPAAEAEAFAAAHPALYDRRSDGVRLATATGQLATASLFETVGFASGAMPDWSSLSHLTIRTEGHPA